MDETKRAFLERRLKRRELWVSLWLARLLSVIMQFADGALPRLWRARIHQTLDILARQTLSIILIRTAQRRGPSSSSRAFCDPRQKIIVSCRAALGAHLRRAMKGRDVAQRLLKIRSVLENLDAHIDALAQRRRRGLSRRLSAFTRVAIGGDGVIPYAPIFAALRGADTS